MGFTNFPFFSIMGRFVPGFIPTILVMLLAAKASHAQSEQLKFERLSIEQGLSQSTVQCIFQDRKGFLWIGTDDGLNQYDGYKFVVYRHDPENPNSISNNTIRTIVEDSSGALWIGTEAGGINKFDPETGKFIHWVNDPGNPNSLSHNDVNVIVEDLSGILWIGTNGGLNRFDRESQKFTCWRHELGNANSLSHNSINCLLQGFAGEIWIGTEHGLNRFDPKTGKFVRWINELGNPDSLGHTHVHAILQEHSGALWIATNAGGLSKFDPATGKFARCINLPGNFQSLSHNSVRSILKDQAGALWIGTRGGGLNKLDPSSHLKKNNGKSGNFIHWVNEPGNPMSLSNNDVISLFEDRSGVLWIGTFSGGLNKLDREKQKFLHWRHQPDNPNSLSNNHVYAIFEDRSGTLWVGTKSGGLNKFDRKQKRFTHYVNDPGNLHSLSHDFVRAIHEDQTGGLWIATRGGGLNKLDRATGEFTRWRHEPDNPHSLSHDEVFSIYEDRSGMLWLGTFNGLNRFDRETQKGGAGKFTHWRHEPDNPNSLSCDIVWSILEDHLGNFWIATNGGGLNQFDRRTEKFRHWRHEPDNPKSLSHDFVFALYEDHTGNLWLGTYGGGLNKFDRETETFTAYREKDGLANDVIYGIGEDREGNLWLSTLRGLSKFNPRSRIFKNYNVHDGLQSNEFELGACHKNAGGEMFFGGVNGFNSFFPEQIKDSPYVPPLVLTDFQIFNKSAGIGGDSPLQKPITETSAITLSYKDNVFSFEFAALCYNSPEKNQYAYIMEGFDREWIYCGTRRSATYTNLAPGNYVFRVKAANHDGIWNEKGVALKIHIAPPFWRTWWAYALYVLIAVAIAYSVRRYELNRLRLKNQVRLEHIEAEKLKELDHLKSHFFANISHEFRTPLTLIQGPLEQLQAGEALRHPQETYNSMLNNTRQLLHLINQLLDLSKLESGKMKLRAQCDNIVAFLKGVVMSFATLAESKKLTLYFHGEDENLAIYFDRDHLEKVFYNLLSNAIKFTPENGRIEVAVAVAGGSGKDFGLGNADFGKISALRNPHSTIQHDKEYVAITVIDTGIGIPAEQLPCIFDRFYQVDNSHTREHGGTGIGLALVKELVELHRGTITVQSEVGKGTKFVVRLPMGKAHLQAEEIVSEQLPVASDQLSVASGQSSVNSDQLSQSSIKDQATIWNAAEIPIIRDDMQPETSNQLQANRNQPQATSDQQPATSRSAAEIPISRNDEDIILIIDDHPEMRSFIRERLEPKYKIVEANDGQEGLEAAREIVPDLIICDIMMPKRDGYELCRLLKSDQRTSHIPIILLTAKAGEDSKVHGLETGADDYITKPFSAKELRARVRNLINLRRNLRERYCRQLVLQPSQIITPSMDGEFLQRVLMVVEKHLEEEEFGVEALAHEVGMSRTQLHRKLRALTNQSASFLIRSVRLQRAADLLKQKAGSVTEIAYRVGFSSPTYFAKCFKEHFGYSPVELKNGEAESSHDKVI